MNERDIRKLSKTELIELLLHQSKQIDELKAKLDKLEAEHVKKSDLLTQEDVWNIVSKCLADKSDEFAKKAEEIEARIPTDEKIQKSVTGVLAAERICEKTEHIVHDAVAKANDKICEQTDKLLREIDKKNTELLLEISRGDNKKRGLFGR